MGPIGCPETSVRSYHYTLHNNPKERRSHLHRVESLQSRSVYETLPLCQIFTTFNILVAVWSWFRLSQFNIYLCIYIGIMLVRLGSVLFVVVPVYCFSVVCVIAALYKRHDYTPNRV